MLFKRRERFQELSLKVGKAFSRLHLSPNQWTLLTIITGALTAFYIIKGIFPYAAFFLAITSVIDFVDGSVARYTKRTSHFGAYLDSIVDRYVEGVIIFGLLFVNMPSVFAHPSIWIFLYFFGAMMTTYVKAAAKEKDLTRVELKGGILERAERMILLFIGILLAYFNTVYLSYIIVILAVLSNVTALQRIYIAVKS